MGKINYSQRVILTLFFSFFFHLIRKKIIKCVNQKMKSTNNLKVIINLQILNQLIHNH